MASAHRFARAIIRDTPIIILDWPSSGLDAASEKLVFEALDRLMLGKTAVVIAHRLSNIRNVDVILVVKDGAIVQQGSHEELLREGGLYSELYEIRLGQVELSPRLSIGQAPNVIPAPAVKELITLPPDRHELKQRSSLPEQAELSRNSLCRDAESLARIRE